MAKTPKISDAEWEVMKALWEDSPQTASGIAEAISEPNGWHPKTVKTLLGRLVKKGAIRFREEGNRYLYTPAFGRDRFVAEESKSFLNRVFGGDATPMLLSFVEQMRLSAEEVEELRAILKKKQKGSE